MPVRNKTHKAVKEQLEFQTAENNRLKKELSELTDAFVDKRAKLKEISVENKKLKAENDKLKAELSKNK